MFHVIAYPYIGICDTAILVPRHHFLICNKSTLISKEYYFSSRNCTITTTCIPKNVEYCISEDLLLQEDLVQIWPMIKEANAMSEELDKKCNFEIALVSPQALGKKHGRTEVSTGQIMYCS